MTSFSVAPRVPRRQMAPQRLLRAASVWFVAATLMLGWLLDLLPWGRWPGVPDSFALVLLFWGLHAPHRVGMLVAFAGGLLLDVHHAALLGENALAYTLLIYWAMVLRIRLLRFGLLAQALHVFPMLVLATGIATGLATLLQGSAWSWWWLADCLSGALVWPLMAWLLQLPQRLAAGRDAG